MPLYPTWETAGYFSPDCALSSASVPTNVAKTDYAANGGDNYTDPTSFSAVTTLETGGGPSNHAAGNTGRRTSHVGDHRQYRHGRIHAMPAAN